MTLIRIDDLGDPRLQPYQGLPKANLTRFSGRFIVEGGLLVERLAASRYRVESVLVDERRVARLPENVPSETPVYVVPPHGVNRIIGFDFHRGRAIFDSDRARDTTSPASFLDSLLTTGSNLPANYVHEERSRLFRSSRSRQL